MYCLTSNTMAKMFSITEIRCRLSENDEIGKNTQPFWLAWLTSAICNTFRTTKMFKLCLSCACISCVLSKFNRKCVHTEYARKVSVIRKPLKQIPVKSVQIDWPSLQAKLSNSIKPEKPTFVLFNSGKRP